MTLLLTGFNHHTAPVSLREQAALSGEHLDMALAMLAERLTESNEVQEAILLATCNRVELYAVTDDPVPCDGVNNLFTTLCCVDREVLDPHLYHRQDEQAARHLMRVASGLDSMIVGETQILGQIRFALEHAQEGGLSGPVLSRLFTRAIHAGKRAHRETEISRHPASVSHSAARLIRRHLARYGRQRVLIIGAGEMASLAGRVLSRYPLSITCINRTDERATRFAEEIGARAQPWATLRESLAWADAVLTATAAKLPILHHSQVSDALTMRPDRPLMVIDIALPRDVEPAARNLPGLLYYDLDDLQTLTDSHHKERERATGQIEAIIAEETACFVAWHHARCVAPLIGELRGWAQEIAAQEVERALNKLPHADPRTRDVIEWLGHRITNQLLHQPTVQLRTQAANGHATRYSHAVRALFALPPEEESA